MNILDKNLHVILVFLLSFSSSVIAQSSIATAIGTAGDIIVTFNDNKLTLWEKPETQDSWISSSLPEKKDAFKAVATASSSTANIIVSLDVQNNIIIRRRTTGERSWAENRLTLPNHHDTYRLAAASGSRGDLVVASVGHQMYLWQKSPDKAEWQESKSPSLRISAPIISLAAGTGKESDLIAAATATNIYILQKLKNSAEWHIKEYSISGGGIISVSASTSSIGDFVAACTTNAIYVWQQNIDNKKWRLVKYRLPKKEKISTFSAARGSKGDILALLTTDDKLHVWQRTKEKALWQKQQLLNTLSEPSSHKELVSVSAANSSYKQLIAVKTISGKVYTWKWLNDDEKKEGQ